jgi:hypothetical protein
MTGAGSLRAANYIFSVAPKDGSVLGTYFCSIRKRSRLPQIQVLRAKWLNENYGESTGEWFYSNIERQLLIEPFIRTQHDPSFFGPMEHSTNAIYE